MVITDNGRVKTQIKIQEKNDFNLLNKMQEGLFVLDSDREQIKFGSDTAIRIMGHKQDKFAGCDMQKNLDSSLLTQPNFLPLNIKMHDLTGRKDDSPNLLTSDNPKGEYLSILDIISGRASEVGVYMIRPGGVLPACQPKGIKNQFCSIHVKQVEYMGEVCTAVYFCCMTHHVDAMRF